MARKITIQAGQVSLDAELNGTRTAHAFCIFFGPTPAGTGTGIRPASAVTVIGKIFGDLTLLRKVKDGARIVIDRNE